MADVSISELPAATDVAGAQLPILQGGATRRASVNLLGGASSYALPGVTGGIARTDGARWAESINVVDWGVVAGANIGDTAATANKARFDAIGAHLRTLPLDSTVRIVFPRGDYECFGRIVWTHAPNLIIEGNGSTLKNTQGRYTGGDGHGSSSYTLWLGAYPWRVASSRTDADWLTQTTYTTGDTIGSIAVGATTATFLTAGRAATYSVGQMILIHSAILFSGGEPPSTARLDWARVTVVDAGANSITWDRPTEFGHVAGHSDMPWLGGTSLGAARILNLTAGWYPDRIVVNDLRLLSKNENTGFAGDRSAINIGARTVIYNNVESYYFFPGRAERFVVNDCTFKVSEPDKGLKYLEWNRGANLLSFAALSYTGVIRAVHNDVHLYGLDTCRAHAMEFNRCTIHLTPASDAYFAPFSGSGIEPGGDFRNNTFITNASRKVTLGSIDKPAIGMGSSRPLFSASFTLTNSGGTTTAITYAASSGGLTNFRDQVWPGRRFIAQHATAGWVFGRVISAAVSGSNVVVQVATTGEMAANAAHFPADFVQIWNISANKFVGTQSEGREGFGNILDIKSSRELVEIRFRPNFFTEDFYDINYLACFVEELVIDVRRPYTGADATAQLIFDTQDRILHAGATAAVRTVTVSTLVAGRRAVFCNGNSGAQAGDTLNQFNSGTFQSQIYWRGTALTERAGGTPNAAVMPDVSCYMRLRRIPDRYFP